MHTFSIKEAVTFGWHKMRAHSGLIFQILLTLFALQVVSAVVQKVLEDTVLGALASIALGVLGVFLGTGVILIALKLAKGEHAHYRELLPEWRIVLRFFLSGLLAGFLAVLPLLSGGLIGLACAFLLAGSAISFSEGTPVVIAEGAIGGLIIAGLFVLAGFIGTLYVAVRLSMARIAVVDGAGIVESLRKSSKLTEGARWKLFGFFVVLVLLNLLGAVALLVGLLLTIPTSVLAFTHVYLKLKSHHGHSA